MPRSHTVPAADKPGPIENYVFNGGYLQAAYMLTGENRAYDKKSGGLSRYYLGGQGPYENAFLVRDEDGGFCSRPWRLGTCLSLLVYRPQLRFRRAGFVNGGIMQGVSLGLNWYLNTNLTVNDRLGLRLSLRSARPAQQSRAATNGFGTEVQLSF